MFTEIYEEAARLSKIGEPAVICTIIEAGGSTPRGTGSKMLVREDGSIIGSVGGGSIELATIKEAKRRMYSNEPYLLECVLNKTGNVGMVCGGEAKVFIEPLNSPPKLFIFGAGHIGYHLSKMACRCAFAVTIIDDRADFATKERFPEATDIVVGKFTEVAPQLKIRDNSYVVIATHGHAGDKDVLEQVLRTDATYIGMIGSKEKNEYVFGALKEKGFTDQDFSKLYAPIGLHIKAKTPEEISVAILAEMIQHRHANDVK